MVIVITLLIILTFVSVLCRVNIGEEDNDAVRVIEVTCNVYPLTGSLKYIVKVLSVISKSNANKTGGVVSNT